MNDYEIGTGLVTCHLSDGRTLDFDNVRYEANRMNNGFLELEDRDGDTFYVPNVDYWTVSYDRPDEPLAQWERDLLDGLEPECGVFDCTSCHRVPVNRDDWTTHHDNDEPPF